MLSKDRGATLDRPGRGDGLAAAYDEGRADRPAQARICRSNEPATRQKASLYRIVLGPKRFSENQAKTRLRIDGQRCLAEAQRQPGSQGGVTGSSPLRSRGDRGRDRPRAVARPRRASRPLARTLRRTAAGLYQRPHRAVSRWHIQEQASAWTRSGASISTASLGDKPGAVAPAPQARHRPPPRISRRTARGHGRCKRLCLARDDYASLSTIARTITGTAWNGPASLGCAPVPIARRISSRCAGSQAARLRSREAGPYASGWRAVISTSPIKAQRMKPAAKAAALRDLHPQIDRA